MATESDPAMAADLAQCACNAANSIESYLNGGVFAPDFQLPDRLVTMVLVVVSAQRNRIERLSIVQASRACTVLQRLRDDLSETREKCLQQDFMDRLEKSDAWGQIRTISTDTELLQVTHTILGRHLELINADPAARYVVAGKLSSLLLACLRLPTLYEHCRESIKDITTSPIPPSGRQVEHLGHLLRTSISLLQLRPTEILPIFIHSRRGQELPDSDFASPDRPNPLPNDLAEAYRSLNSRSHFGGNERKLTWSIEKSEELLRIGDSELGTVLESRLGLKSTACLLSIKSLSDSTGGFVNWYPEVARAVDAMISPTMRTRQPDNVQKHGADRYEHDSTSAQYGGPKRGNQNTRSTTYESRGVKKAAVDLKALVRNTVGKVENGKEWLQYWFHIDGERVRIGPPAKTEGNPIKYENS